MMPPHNRCCSQVSFDAFAPSVTMVSPRFSVSMTTLMDVENFHYGSPHSIWKRKENTY